ncbi:hypothetical protein LEN26_012002, partial [Aphanomyces euteiches]
MAERESQQASSGNAPLACPVEDHNHPLHSDDGSSSSDDDCEEDLDSRFPELQERIAESMFQATHVDVVKDLIKPQNLKRLVFSSVEHSVNEPEDIFHGTPRPKLPNLDAVTPIGLFFQLFPLQIIEHIVFHSNLYKSQSHGTCNDITVDEFLKFLGLVIAHSSCTWSSIRRNWSTTTTAPFPLGTYGAYMSRNRFAEISQYMHFADNTKQPPRGDKFYKIRPIIDQINETFQSSYVHGAHLAFDEGIWSTKSKYCPAKQFNPNKPHKWGLKVFMLCCATSGYCSKFEVYQGKDSSDGLQAGPMSLIRNVRHLAGSKRVIVCDRYYTSLSVVIQLLSMGLYCVGTVRTSSMAFPKVLLLKKGSVDRGHSAAMVTEVLGGKKILASVWMDRKPVYLLSSAYMNGTTSVSRRVGSNNDVFPTIRAIEMYNRYMGGVDRHDFLRMAINNIQSAMSFRKWYKMCFAAILDMVVTNAFILYKMLKKDKTSNVYSHGDFLEALASELLRTDISRPTSTRSRRESLHTQVNHEISMFQSGEGHSGQAKNQRHC